MYKLIISQTIYKNIYNEVIEKDLDFDKDANLLNHKEYLEYSSKHIDELMFDTYEDAHDFFTEGYTHLLNFEHHIDINEDDTISYVGWDRGENVNFNLNIIFSNMK
jgi:hypothetical protein